MRTYRVSTRSSITWHERTFTVRTADLEATLQEFERYSHIILWSEEA